MPKGTAFVLTPTRRAKMSDMLRQQWTVSGIAAQYGVSYKFLIKLFKREKFNHRAIRMSGLHMLRAETYGSIGSIADDAKRVKAGLEFLNQYPIVDDSDDALDGSTVKSKDITKSILDELNA